MILPKTANFSCAISIITKVGTLYYIVHLMKYLLYTIHTLLVYLLLVSAPAIAIGQTVDSITTSKPKVFYFKLDAEIMPAAERQLENAYEQAEQAEATYMLMELNTFGGRVDVADRMRTMVMNAPMTTVVWVNNNAASAGALISIAHDSIYMTKGASIGAATVVSGEDGTQMPDKYQSYMRSTMRSTAEAKGRDPKIAEAMVDDRIVIEGIIDSGYTLTFTADEAFENGFANGIANDKDEVLGQLGITEHELINYEATPLEGVINFLLHPAVSGILMSMIFFGLFFELQTPGVGFPLAAAITGAVLYFAPLYLEGLAEHWEILIFIVGVILMALEVFVIPGFGAAGISGIVLMATGLVLALVGNVNFDFTYVPSQDIVWALARVVISMSALVLMFLIFSDRIMNSKGLSKIALKESLNVEEGYTTSIKGLAELVGETGVAATDLRPSGKVTINDDRYEASTDGELIEKGTAIIVTRSRGNYIEVKKYQAPQA